MKIAYLINQYPQPSQSFIRREIHALEALGFHVDRFTLRTWDQELVDPGDQTEKTRARVILSVGAVGLLRATLAAMVTRPTAFLASLRLAWKAGRRGDRGRIYHLIYLAEACVLVRWLRECGAQHLHAHFGTNSTTVAMLAHRLGGPPYSFTCHGPEEFDRADALKLGEKIARAAFVVAVSEYGRSQLFRWSRYADWSKIHVLRCGIDSVFLTDDAPPPLSDDNHRLVCVGRLAEQKGQLLLVEAAAQLRVQGVSFQLVLVGDGPMRAEIELLIRQHHLQNHVTITGWRSNQDVRDEIISSRALILPSFAEGLPGVLMEALALQRPVVSTYVAGIPELVEPGNCGYLVPAGSVKHLAEVLQQVLRASPGHLREMGREGRRRVAERHDVRKQAAALAHLFTSLAQQRESQAIQADHPASGSPKVLSGAAE